MASDDFLDAEVRDHRGAAVIRGRGEIDKHALAVLRRAVVEARLRSRRLVFDMSETSFIDGSGLGVLVGAAHAYGRDAVTVRSPTRRVRRLLELTGITALVRLEDVVSLAPERRGSEVTGAAVPGRPGPVRPQPLTIAPLRGADVEAVG